MMTHTLRKVSSAWGRAICAVAVGLAALCLSGGPAWAGPNGQVTYHGGTDGVGVMTNPQVYLVFWGTQWGAQTTDTNGDLNFAKDPSNAAPLLQEFFKGLGTDNEQWSGIATQYCEGVAAGSTSCNPNTGWHVGYPTGEALAGVWADQSGPAPASASEADVAHEAIKAAAFFGNTTAAYNSNAVYVVLSPTGTNEDGPLSTNGCAKHGWNGQVGVNTPNGYGHVAFVEFPYQTDAGICNQPVTEGNVFTLPLAHEYIETITDPFAPSSGTGSGGWYVNTGGGNEIADNCTKAGFTGIALATGTFDVPALWSNDANDGQGGCVFSHPIIQGGGIVNGGFESVSCGSGSLLGWTATGSVSTAIFKGHANSCIAAELGSPNGSSGSSELSQQFTAPGFGQAEGNSGRLTFWYSNTCTGTPGHSFSATLEDLTTSAFSTILPATCESGAGWVPVEAPVVAGHTYLLTFSTDDGSDGHEDALVDDVNVMPQTAPLPAPGWTQVSSAGQVTWGALPPFYQSPTLSYVILRDGDAIATVPGAAFVYYDQIADGKAHTYQVEAFTTNGPPGIVPDVSPPSTPATEPPLNLRSGPQGQICWDPVLGHNGPGDYYQVYLDGGASPMDSVSATGHDPATPVCWAPAASYYQNAWTTGSTHTIAVTTYNQAVGTSQSQWSSPFTFTFIQAPGGLSAISEAGSVYLSWTWQLTSKLEHYNVYRDGTLLAAGLTTSSYADSSVGGCIVHAYTVTEQFASSWESVPSNPVHVAVC